MHTVQKRRQGAWPTTRITLLQRVANTGDHGSWKCFVDIYGPLIHRYTQRRGLQETDALDVVQDVLLQVSQTIGGFRYDVERGLFRNWLGTVTHRSMLKHVAKSRRLGGVSLGELSHMPQSSSLECPQSLDEVWVETFNAHLYREAVKRQRLHFSEETWCAFDATFSENRDPNQVAEELGRSVGWVYQAKFRVIRRLRAEIMHMAEDSVLLNPPSGG